MFDQVMTLLRKHVFFSFFELAERIPVASSRVWLRLFIKQLWASQNLRTFFTKQKLFLLKF
jgi:hypothetical protein